MYEYGFFAAKQVDHGPSQVRTLGELGLGMEVCRAWANPNTGEVSHSGREFVVAVGRRLAGLNRWASETLTPGELSPDPRWAVTYDDAWGVYQDMSLADCGVVPYTDEAGKELGWNPTNYLAYPEERQ